MVGRAEKRGAHEHKWRELGVKRHRGTGMSGEVTPERKSKGQMGEVEKERSQMRRLGRTWRTDGQPEDSEREGSEEAEPNRGLHYRTFDCIR